MLLLECIDFLRELHQCESQKYNGTSILYFDENSDCGRCVYDSLHPVGSKGHMPSHIHIGIGKLLENVSTDDTVLDSDVVWCGWQLLHEIHHDRMHTAEYMKNNVDSDIEYMSKICLISDYNDVYKNELYSNNPSEIMADLYAIQSLNGVFAASDIDSDKCVLNFINSGKSVFVKSYCREYRDVIDAYEVKYKDSLFSEDVESACTYIADHNPEYFRGYQCIRDKYCVKQNMKNRVEDFVSKKVLRIVPQEFEDIANQSEQQDGDEYE